MRGYIRSRVGDAPRPSTMRCGGICGRPPHAPRAPIPYRWRRKAPVVAKGRINPRGAPLPVLSLPTRPFVSSRPLSTDPPRRFRGPSVAPRLAGGWVGGPTPRDIFLEGRTPARDSTAGARLLPSGPRAMAGNYVYNRHAASSSVGAPRVYEMSWFADADLAADFDDIAGRVGAVTSIAVWGESGPLGRPVERLYRHSVEIQ